MVAWNDKKRNPSKFNKNTKRLFTHTLTLPQVKQQSPF